MDKVKIQIEFVSKVEKKTPQEIILEIEEMIKPFADKFDDVRFMGVEKMPHKDKGPNEVPPKR